jgi:acyl-coenzyme A thioesterase PaaI-like protein
MSHDPPLPAPFVERFAPLPEVKFSGPRSSFHGCFGCGPEHDIGLRVRTFEAEGGVLAPIVIPRRFEGPPGAAHGGIVAAYLDEILAGAAVERPLLGRGRAVRDWGKYIDLEATIEDWETREVVAKATARFLPIREAS